MTELRGNRDIKKKKKDKWIMVRKICSGLPFPSPGDLPDPGMEPVSPALQEDSLC